jgi:radical SAM protein with 4Fe4S-binding SPASM domain
LNCIHCSSDAKPSSLKEMSRDSCLHTLEEASKMGAKEVAFSGGEPLIWPHIYRAVETATRIGLEVCIYTSGNINSFEEQARRLNELGARRFIFSLFGATATSHERITRVTGSFDQTVEAMSYACEIGMCTEVHFVPMSTNYRELTDLVLLSKELGASQVSVLRLVQQGRASLLRRRILTRIQNLELRRMVGRLRESGYSVRTGSPYNFLMLNQTPKCSAAIDRLIIGPELDVFPCDAFKQVKADELVGTSKYSTLGQYSLKDCWETSPYLEAIRQYLTTPFSEPCASCLMLEKCLSGCLAQKVLVNGDLQKGPDPDCMRGAFGGEKL